MRHIGDREQQSSRPSRLNDRVWTVALAGGAGRRLAAVTGGVPKQFWPMGDSRTLLEATLDRMAPIAPRSRTVVVVDRSHKSYVRAMADRLGHVLYQPEDRGTAAGVLLALLPILDAEPEAIVAMTPTDHGIADLTCFRAGVVTAVNHVRRFAADVVLFGVEPLGSEESYGWITPGAAIRGTTLRRVGAFVEKPPQEVAARLQASGAVWNTMVLVARVSVLLQMFRRQQPVLTGTLTKGWQGMAIGGDALRDEYARLTLVDFSREVLAPSTDLLVHTWPSAMGWTDLGTPARFAAWYARTRASSAWTAKGAEAATA